MEVQVGIGAHDPLTRRGAPTGATEERDEAEWLAALARGEARALEALYDCHNRAVYSLALRLLGDRGAAEEVVQETFVKLWRRPGAYLASRGRLLPWLLGVAHHHAVDLLRRRQLELRHRAPDAPPSEDHVGRSDGAFGRASDDTDPETHATQSEARQLIQDALASLPPVQRQPIELAYYRGLTQVEIAALLGEPLGTVKTRMRLALQRLRSTPALAAVWDEAAR